MLIIELLFLAVTGNNAYTCYMHKSAEFVGNSNTPVCSSCPKIRDSTTYHLLPTIYQHGFTIVELLVVIVVIGILAAITIVSYAGISGKATVASMQSDLSNSSQQLKVFQVLNGVYPQTNNCAIAESSTNICLKKSGSNNLSYSYNNSTSPQTFCITVINGTNNYRITNDSVPVSGTCSSLYASGGTIADVSGYRIHTFTSSSTFTVNSGISNVDVLIVGGGGGGGRYGGGGGAGGYQYITSMSVSNQAYAVTVGTGGNGWVGDAQAGGNAASGLSSSFNSVISAGGGGGGNYGNGTGGSVGLNGGSGGGSGNRNVAEGTSPLNSSGNTPATSPSQGNGGGSAGGTSYNSISAGGGGGAGAVGANGSAGGAGGIGVSNSITGTAVYYAGGGSGSQVSAKLAGGLGGGGYGQIAGTTTADVDGVAGTGGGGGGARDGVVGGVNRAGNGGSGVVVVRYLLP